MTCENCNDSIGPFTAWWFRGQRLCDDCKRLAEANAVQDGRSSTQ